MKKSLVLLLAASLFCVSPVFGATKTISVNQFVEHPALDAVLKGLQDSLKDGGVEVEYNVQDDFQ